LLNVRRNVADEGVMGVLRILRNVMRDKAARERVLLMKQTFTRYKRYMNGIAIVAHKRS
jgi:hypothetical protein